MRSLTSFIPNDGRLRHDPVNQTPHENGWKTENRDIPDDCAQQRSGCPFLYAVLGGEMKRASGVHAFPRTKKAAQEDAGMNLFLPVLQVLPFFILPDYSAA